MKKMSGIFVPGFVDAVDVLIYKIVMLESDQLMDVAQYVVSGHIQLTFMVSNREMFELLFHSAGGGVSVDIDKDGLDTYSGEFENARSTSEIRRRMTESDIVRDDSDKCDVEAQFTSNGNANNYDS